MAKYIIEGGYKLTGRIKISGNKNGILPCLAASLLTEEEVIIRNVPNISDVVGLIKILTDLGATIKAEDHTIRICCAQIKHADLPEDIANKIRASILFVGPLLARFGSVDFPHPGGCVIGKRSIDQHLDGLRDLGFDFRFKQGKYKGSRVQKIALKKEIFLGEASVTVTEGLLLASVLTPSEITLKNCALEPHVVDLCRMLIGMGARIEGVGSSTLTVYGVSKLHGVDFTIGSDYVEFGTYAIVAALTGGEIEIEKNNLPDLEPIIYHLSKMGINFKNKEDVIVVSAHDLRALPKLHTNIWPGFPTDLMSAAIVLATRAQGVSLMHDWMYESRMFFVDKLITMGANIIIADPHRVLISGPASLQGKRLESPDLRAGMALVLAALVADGVSTIDRAELIERGYEDVVEKLTSLGAHIQRVEN